MGLSPNKTDIVETRAMKLENDIVQSISKAVSEENLTDSDLAEIIEAIDEFLLRQKYNPVLFGLFYTKKRKSGEKIFTKIKVTIKSVVEEIKKFSGKSIKIALEVLNIIGQSHWTAVGLVLLASVLEIFETGKRNVKECLMLLQSMNDLAKIVLELKPLPHETVRTQAKMKEAIHTIIKGAIMCSKVMQAGTIKGAFKAEDYKEDLLDIRQETEELRSVLHAHISICIFKWLCENGKECRGLNHSAENDVLGERSPTTNNSNATTQTPREDANNGSPVTPSKTETSNPAKRSKTK